MELEFSGKLWFWKGPSPFHFVTVPEPQSVEIEAVSGVVRYGWGCIRVGVQVGDTAWSTSLFPKDGGYVVPVKDAVRRAEGLELGDVVAMQLTIAL